MSGIAAAARVAYGGLALAFLAPHGTPPVQAQEQTSAPALVERLRQIQGQLGPGAAPPAQGQPARADELIRQIEAIRQQSLASSATGRPPALGEEEVRALVREGLGVDVLSARLVERDGQPVSLDWEEVAYGRTRAAQGIAPAEPLFPRVEPATAA